MSKKGEGKARILVVDDEAFTRDFFRNLLVDEGYEIITIANGEEALKVFTQKNFNLVLLDLKIPGCMDGIEILKKMKEMQPGIVVIMISGHGTLEVAVEAVKLGAENFLSKPFNSPEEVLIHIEKALEFQKVKKENQFLQEQFALQVAKEKMIGDSLKMQQVFELIQKVSSLDTNILLIGESGTGKELVAQAVHESSLRRNKRFMAVNCGALTDTLLEDTLFGHEIDAFSGANKEKKGYFEEANEGTIFLDEIGEASLPLQVELLRVLQTGEFRRVGGTETLHSDVRIISATNKDLAAAVEKREFREDLYWRINVIKISLPALRERKEDIPLLVNHFLDKFAKKLKKNVAGITPEAMNLLRDFNWPGNVRQLENFIERAIALCVESTIGLDCLSPEITSDVHVAGRDNSYLSYRQAKEQFERNYFSSLLRMFNNNVANVAQKTKIDPATLYRKIKKYNIAVDEK